VGGVASIRDFRGGGAGEDQGTPTEETPMSYPIAYAPPVFAPPVPVPARRRSAPPSVHVIAVLQYLGGVSALAFAAVVGYIAVVAGSETPTDQDLFHPRTVAVVLGIVAGVTGLCALAAILLGRKLQRGRQWARVVVLMLSVLSVAAVVVSLVAEPTTLWHAAGAVHPVLCLALLNTRAARSWFRWHTW
jgi:cytochrome c biogenesis protein CcdA